MSFSSIPRDADLEVPFMIGDTGILEAPDCTSNPTLSETMLTFAPGELSTLAGGENWLEGNGNLTTKSFNFGDLPCPPQSVMVGLSTFLYISVNLPLTLM